MQTAVASGWPLGQFWLFSDGPKSSGDAKDKQKSIYPSRQLNNIICSDYCSQRLPRFLTTLILNFAFVQSYNNDHRFGRELQSEKAQSREYTPLPSLWAAGNCKHSYKFLSSENCIYSSKTNPRMSPLPRALDPILDHSGPHWFICLLGALPEGWDCSGWLALALQRHKLT